MMKKAIAALVILATLVGTSASFAATSDAPVFSDVSVSHWAYSSIQAMSEKGVVQGQGGNTFNPEGTLTRAEFIAVVTRAMIPNKIDATIKDTWYAANYKAAIDSGLVLEDEMPNEVASMGTNITRYEMARILVRADENINGNEATTADSSAIKDYGDVPVKYTYFVEQAYAKGLLSGYSDGTFSGGQNMSRAQAAVVMERLLNAKVEVPEEPENPERPGVPDWDTRPIRPDVMPEVGLYSDEYQDYLDNCGEPIVTKTIKYKMTSLFTGESLPNVILDVWRAEGNPELATLEDMFVTQIESDSSGNGSFVLKMPESLYNKTMGGETLSYQFEVYNPQVRWAGTGAYSDGLEMTIGGVDYMFGSTQITHAHVRDNSPDILNIRFLTAPKK